MKTQAQIYMDYQNACSQAGSLEQIARNLDNVADGQMQSCLGQVSSHWKGHNSEAYVRKGRVVQDKIRNTAKDLRNAASAVRRMAKNTYDAEMRALEIAKAREY